MPPSCFPCFFILERLETSLYREGTAFAFILLLTLVITATVVEILDVSIKVTCSHIVFPSSY